jgi:pimeloyl-ACP methyl ester carboxylesterase
VGEPADGWLERDGFDLHYLEWRAESAVIEPPVLLLHGLSSNAHYWGRVAALLPNRRVIAIDQRGHGLTGRPPRTPSLPAGFAMDQLLGDVTLTLDELALSRPVVVGHSWGATVALEFVARNPSLASGLVFIDGPVQSAANLFSWEEGQKFMQPPLPRYAAFAEAIEDSRRDFGAAWREDLEPFVMARVMQDGESLVLTLTAAVRLELLRGLYESPVDSLWTQVEVPTIAILARGGPDRISDWRESGARRVAMAAPKVRVRWLDTPHDIPLFGPDAVSSEIERIASGSVGVASSEAAAGNQLQD